MPLIKSGSKEARQKNIREMIDAGDPSQAVAAGYSNQRRFSRGKRRGRRATRA